MAAIAAGKGIGEERIGKLVLAFHLKGLPLPDISILCSPEANLDEIIGEIQGRSSAEIITGDTAPDIIHECPGTILFQITEDTTPGLYMFKYAPDQEAVLTRVGS